MKKLGKMIRTSLKMKAIAVYLAVAMASITGVPNISSAGTVPTHKSAEASTPAYDRQADLALIRGALNSESGRIAMAKVGTTALEMETNIAKLSDAQLNIAAEKIRANLPAGGDSGVVIWGVGGVVIVVIVIIVIILLIRSSAMAGRY